MYHSAKDLTIKIEAMLRKSKSLQTLEETQKEGKQATGFYNNLGFYDDVHKYLVEDIQALARDIANDGN